MEWKHIHDTALRGAFCAIWMAGLVTTVADLLCVIADDPGPVQNTDIGFLLGALAVTIVAAYAHFCLIRIRLNLPK